MHRETPRGPREGLAEDFNRLLNPGHRPAMTDVPPRILILTAAFGEGHNSAARNLGQALEAAGVLTRVADPCLLGAPRLTGLLSRGYRLVTNHAPAVWGAIYRSTDRCDFSRPSPMMRAAERALGDLIRDFQPTALVCTYPLYPYFLQRLPQAPGTGLPVFTVVTDSIEINAAWLRAPSDFWIVTDPATREGMVRAGLAAERVVDTGFPVPRVFAQQGSVAADDPCDPFRVLYFATAQRSFVTSHGRALLEASPAVRLTLVMGRNTGGLLGRALHLKREFPGRVRLVGWTRRVPQRLADHHLVVGKAGGATVHEAIAARCPMLIHHLVPGQEEGNLSLLERIGGGGLADSPAALSRQLKDLLADRAAGWRGMKSALARHGRDAGALHAARFILQTLAPPPSS